MNKELNYSYYDFRYGQYYVDLHKYEKLSDKFVPYIKKLIKTTDSTFSCVVRPSYDNSSFMMTKVEFDKLKTFVEIELSFGLDILFGSEF
jgi:hypothetical protein